VNSPPPTPEVILTNFFAEPTVLVRSNFWKSHRLKSAAALNQRMLLLWRMLSRLETCIVYSCIWSVTLAKSIVPRKTWRKLWHPCISKLFLTKMQVKFSIFFHHGSLNVIGDKFLGILISMLAIRKMSFNVTKWRTKWLPKKQHLRTNHIQHCSLNFRCWWRRVHEDASQGMYMSKIEIFFFAARILQNQRMLCCGECIHD
jgi:hypothetical protein